jgi:hypothetical protein
LRAEGFTLTNTVNGIFFRGFAHLDLDRGGSVNIWAVQFRREGCTGVLSHGLCRALSRNTWPSIRKRWEAADYILTVDGDCGL